MNNPLNTFGTPLMQSYQARIGTNGEVILSIPAEELRRLQVSPGDLISVTISGVNTMMPHQQAAVPTKVLFVPAEAKAEKEKDQARPAVFEKR